MAFQKKATSAPAANVARMMQVGDAPTATASDLSYLDKVTDVIPGGTMGSPVSEGNPDPETLHVDPARIRIEGAPGTPEQGQVTENATAIDMDEVEDARFKGKSKREIFEAYKNLESEKGRLANETGEYRRMFDAHVLNQARQLQQQPEHAQKVDESELLSQLLTNPSKVLSGIEAKVMRQFQQAESQKLVNQIKAENNHLVSDPAFVPFLKTVPRAILSQVDHDPAQLMFVINQFKATANPQAAQSAPALTTRDIKVGVAAGTGQPSKVPPRQWRRSEIIKLMANDAEYRAHLPEIELAYSQGRVIRDK